MKKAEFLQVHDGVIMSEILLSGVFNPEASHAAKYSHDARITQARYMLSDDTALKLAIEEIRKNTDNKVMNSGIVFHCYNERVEKRKNPKSGKQQGIRFLRKNQIDTNRASIQFER